MQLNYRYRFFRGALLFCYLIGNSCFQRYGSGATASTNNRIIPPPRTSHQHWTSIKEAMTAAVTATTTNSHESSVLRELKEIIQKQAHEIQILQQQLQEKERPKQTHGKDNQSHVGGHHGASPASSDELQHYLDQPFYRVALKRVGWLSLFLVSLSMTALIMNGFEHTLERQLELAYFVPLLAGHGGNTGGQSVGTVLSALSAGTIRRQDAPRVILKEAMSGIMVGTALGVLVGVLAFHFMGISSHVSTVICCTLPLVSTIAATLGSAIPFLCLALGLDPSVIAAPAMTSFVDVSGLMSYFLIANWIFALFGLQL